MAGIIWIDVYADEFPLMIEDAESGVQAAYAAGMNVIRVPDLKEPDLTTHAYVLGVCGSLLEARETIFHLLEQESFVEISPAKLGINTKSFQGFLAGREEN